MGEGPFNSISIKMRKKKPNSMSNYELGSYFIPKNKKKNLNPKKTKKKTKVIWLLQRYVYNILIIDNLG